MQFAEGLSDRHAADAVRGQLDWKYMLGLELTDPSFDASILSEFRARLIQGKVEQQVLQPLPSPEVSQIQKSVGVDIRTIESMQCRSNTTLL